MLPRRDLLEGARDPETLEALIQQAEVVLRTYQPSWSAFLTAPQLSLIHISEPTRPY